MRDLEGHGAYATSETVAEAVTRVEGTGAHLHRALDALPDAEARRFIEDAAVAHARAVQDLAVTRVLAALCAMTEGYGGVFVANPDDPAVRALIVTPPYPGVEE